MIYAVIDTNVQNQGDRSVPLISLIIKELSLRYNEYTFKNKEVSFNLI